MHQMNQGLFPAVSIVSTLIVNIMEVLSGATIEVVLNDNTIQGFFQTKDIQLAFSDCPEVLMVDATYKLNNSRICSISSGLSGIHTTVFTLYLQH